MSFFSRKIPKFNVMDINMIILHLRACWGTMDMLILNFNVEKKSFYFLPFEYDVECRFLVYGLYYVKV